MNKVIYRIPNISCGHCVHTIEMEIGDLEGVQSVKASAETKTAVVTFVEPTTEEKLKTLLSEINYPVEN